MEKKKRVFVTGGAHGIGKAVVEAFAERGNRVAFCDVNKENGEALQTTLPEYIRFFSNRCTGCLPDRVLHEYFVQ